MNIKILRPLSRFAGRVGLLAKKFSPEILTGAGIVGGVVATVIACKATLDLNEDLEPIKMEISSLKYDQKNSDTSVESYGKDLTRAYFRGGLRVVRHYAVPIALGGISITAILLGHGVLQKRNAALVAAYNALELAYQGYRDRVREEFGAEKDYEIVNHVANKNAEKNRSTDKTKALDTTFPSGTARFFDKYNPNWNSANWGLNVHFLKVRQTWLNDKLRAKGFVTLNEVYKELGFEETNEGLVLGWVLDRQGGNFIDFGIWDPKNESARSFVNGDADAVLLQFNHDGVILDRI